MLPIDKNQAFEDYQKGKERIKMENLNDSSIDNLNRSRITINYNGPVMQFNPVEKREEVKPTSSPIQRLAKIAKFATKAIVTGTKLIGISAPVVAPLLLTSNKAKQILIDTISDKKTIVIDKKSKEYFDSLKENDIFYLYYTNEIDKTPLTDYLIDIKESIDVDKIMYFNQSNNFVEFFIKYLKRKSVMIKYSEFKNKSDNMVLEVEYLLFKHKKKLHVKVKSYALRKISANNSNEVEQIDDDRLEILH